VGGGEVATTPVNTSRKKEVTEHNLDTREHPTGTNFCWNNNNRKLASRKKKKKGHGGKYVPAILSLSRMHFLSRPSIYSRWGEAGAYNLTYFDLDGGGGGEYAPDTFFVDKRYLPSLRRTCLGYRGP